MSDADTPKVKRAYKFTVGEIPGYPPGSRFSDRKSLARAGVHRVIRAGIHGHSRFGAYSICLSGGYEDDEDDGDRIIYVGSGGRDEKTKKQIGDQSLTDFGNKSLVVSCQKRQPVRVIRAEKGGYTYSGLYMVESVNRKPGKAGFRMYFFELTKVNEGNEQEARSVTNFVHSDDPEVDDDILATSEEEIMHHEEEQVQGATPRDDDQGHKDSSIDEGNGSGNRSMLDPELEKMVMDLENTMDKAA